LSHRTLAASHLSALLCTFTAQLAFERTAQHISSFVELRRGLKELLTARHQHTCARSASNQLFRERALADSMAPMTIFGPRKGGTVVHRVAGLVSLYDGELCAARALIEDIYYACACLDGHTHRAVDRREELSALLSRASTEQDEAAFLRTHRIERNKLQLQMCTSPLFSLGHDIGVAWGDAMDKPTEGVSEPFRYTMQEMFDDGLDKQAPDEMKVSISPYF
jgi:hypothetical protein